MTDKKHTEHDMGSEFKVRLRNVQRMQKKLSKARVGLPLRVVFEYSVGTVTCLPREKKWIIKVKDGAEVVYRPSGRNDVTKYKARLFLKIVMIGLFTK